MLISPISCRRAAELESKSMEQPLSFWERILLRYHYYICKHVCCNSFKEKLELMRSGCKKMSRECQDPPAESPCLSKDCKRKILDALKCCDSDKE